MEEKRGWDLIRKSESTSIGEVRKSFGEGTLTGTLPWEGPPHQWPGDQPEEGPEGGEGEVGGQCVRETGGGDGGGPGTAGAVVQN